MWQRRARSRCRCCRGEPRPGRNLRARPLSQASVAVGVGVGVVPDQRGCCVDGHAGAAQQVSDLQGRRRIQGGRSHQVLWVLTDGAGAGGGRRDAAGRGGEETGAAASSTTYRTQPTRAKEQMDAEGKRQSRPAAREVVLVAHMQPGGLPRLARLSTGRALTRRSNKPCHTGIAGQCINQPIN